MRQAICDCSALVKLIVAEPESQALVTVLETCSNLATSGLALVEVSRAVRRKDPSLAAQLRRLFNRLEIIAANRVILDLASRLEPPDLRSLNAIQLASTLTLRPIGLDFIAFDKRLQGRVCAPSSLRSPDPVGPVVSESKVARMMSFQARCQGLSQ